MLQFFVNKRKKSVTMYGSRNTARMEKVKEERMHTFINNQYFTERLDGGY